MAPDIKNLLVQRLSQKGLDKNLIPGYLRILANSICIIQDQNLTLINQHMRQIGWNDFDLDYHTFELARSCLEAAGFIDQKYKPSKWYEEIVAI
jgi:hypothetical protein